MAVNEGLAAGPLSPAHAIILAKSSPFCRWGKETATSVRQSRNVSRNLSLVAENEFQPASLELKS